MQQLLILPSHRVLSFQANKNILKLLSVKCEDYTVCGPLIAMHHYKTVQIFNRQDFSKPIMEDTYLKKVQTTDLKFKEDSQKYQCITSDKFGDMHRIVLSANNELVSPAKDQILSECMNSNLGIPRYLKTFTIPSDNKIYYVLGDEEKRVKVYNGNEAHELLTVWHMVNRHSVDILSFPNKKVAADEFIILLTKFYDKNTLQEDVDLHWLKKSQLQEEEYPGKIIDKKSKFDQKKCKYFTVSQCGDSHLLIYYLFEDCIEYELFKANAVGDKEEANWQPFSSIRLQKIAINQGSWDYMHPIYTTQEVKGQVFIAYGSQVENPVALEEGKEDGVDVFWPVQENNNIALNKYENVVGFPLLL